MGVLLVSPVGLREPPRNRRRVLFVEGGRKETGLRKGETKEELTGPGTPVQWSSGRSQGQKEGVDRLGGP